MELQFARSRSHKMCIGWFSRRILAGTRSLKHPNPGKCGGRPLLLRCLHGLQPKMAQEPDGIQTECRYPFDSECPTDSLYQKTEIDDRLGVPLCLSAKPTACDHLGARECGGIACHS